MATVKREVRTFSGARIGTRQETDEPGAKGHAAVFNQMADLGWLKETIKPGAFKRVISEKQDVRCLLNHDSNVVLGRTKNDTLSLSEDEQGLFFDCQFPGTQAARDLSALLDRGDIDQCSFGFTVRKQTWRENVLDDGGTEIIREIEDVDLFDVSPVTFPAYEGTDCEPRSLWPDGMPAEVRAHRPINRNDDCECECPECEDGDCLECSNEQCDGPNCEGHDRSHPAPAKMTKRVDGEDLDADCFLIVGDASDTSSWRLGWKFSTDVKTKTHLANAIVRFNGLRRASQEQKQKAWPKLAEMCRAHEIDLSEGSSLRKHLTTEQLRDFEPPDLETICERALTGIQRQVDEFTRVVAHVTKTSDPIPGIEPDPMASERARAVVRAIQADL